MVIYGVASTCVDREESSARGSYLTHSWSTSSFEGLIQKPKGKGGLCEKYGSRRDSSMCNQARNSLGRKVVKLRTRHVTKHPSVQGTWTTDIKFCRKRYNFARSFFWRVSKQFTFSMPDSEILVICYDYVV